MIDTLHTNLDSARALEAWSEFYRRNCRERRIDYVRIDTRTPFDRALLAYLEKRARLL